MCGICGFNWGDRELVSLMGGSLAHRGPDSSGIYVSDRMSLGHTRLKVIDLSGGADQPMSDESGEVQLVYNGEIYNYRELRAELEGKGHTFKTGSDTEVLLNSYLEYDVGCVTMLNGMFSFAVWDGRHDRLWLARDRMGQKPLYYCLLGNGFLFASELKALLKYPGLERSIDLDALRMYLAFEFVPAPYSIIEGVRKLPPGHTLTLEDGNVKVGRYWGMRFEDSGERRSAKLEGIRSRLKSSVERRLVSDVPLGVFLSGGLDSSIIVSLMSELVPPDRIKTFTIGFEDRSFDESNHARRVAEHFGTDHHERLLKADDMLGILEEVVGFLDEPFGDASVIPTYLLSKYTREHVTVALGGDGGDELFCGYPTFQAEKIHRYYRIMPLPVRRVLKRLADSLPVSTSNISLDFKLKRFVSGDGYDGLRRHQAWLGSFTPEEQEKLLSADVKNRTSKDPYGIIDDAFAGSGVEGFDGRLIYFYSRFYLGGDILAKLDRASMAVSLEARSPFLDHYFIEYACSIPYGDKVRGLTTKAILKDAFRDSIPADIVDRSKKGFGIPVAEWLKKDLKPLALKAFDRERLEEEGIFNPDHVQGLLDEHFTGRADHRKKIWTLLMFQMWRERFGV
ncbi:MAG: asparagine synthase (glutamine-hydrolyzing) [Candidatus Altiarchaeales archaeon]|nr:asparagine synthase (glutamine-hydrolyzing) [Candidatus Altiarchaeales archaeon]MBD3416556.1 asparagine synthase (glutamine-hydrolyzing) [Candidatus Altiarchaeales archaeon]